MKVQIIAATAALLAFVAPAAAFEFDNSTCKTYLTGTWDSTMEREGAVVTNHSVYNEDGTFTVAQTMSMGGGPEQARRLTGTWDAKPGPAADSCEASMVAAEIGTQTVVLTVIDENTVKGPDGGISKRAAEEMH